MRTFLENFNLQTLYAAKVDEWRALISSSKAENHGELANHRSPKFNEKPNVWANNERLPNPKKRRELSHVLTLTSRRVTVSRLPALHQRTFRLSFQMFDRCELVEL